MWTDEPSAYFQTMSLNDPYILCDPHVSDTAKHLLFNSKNQVQKIFSYLWQNQHTNAKHEANQLS